MQSLIYKKVQLVLCLWLLLGSSVVLARPKTRARSAAGTPVIGQSVMQTVTRLRTGLHQVMPEDMPQNISKVPRHRARPTSRVTLAPPATESGKRPRLTRSPVPAMQVETNASTDKTPMELHRLNHTAAKAIDTMPSKLWMGTPMTIREAEEEKIAEAINQTAGQVPEYPLYEEGSAHFNPAYYSEGEQVAELHLPHFTLTSLASSYQGPLAGFLTDLLQILANMSDVSKERIGILGLHGKFKKVSKAQLPSLGEDSASTTQQRAHEEVVVRFHIQDTGKENETSKKQVLSRLHAAILSPTSPLRIGPLANVMHNCTISVFAPGEKEQLPHTEMREETATRVSSMVLPIGISAAFTAVLIWLAAW